MRISELGTTTANTKVRNISRPSIEIISVEDDDNKTAGYTFEVHLPNALYVRRTVFSTRKEAEQKASAFAQLFDSIASKMESAPKNETYWVMNDRKLRGRDERVWWRPARPEAAF